ncbi:MAG: hypothetical protein ACK5H2_10785 [Beutenbergiaceae bacterium]
MLTLILGIVFALSLLAPATSASAVGYHPQLRLVSRAAIGHGWATSEVMTTSDVTGDMRADILAVRPDRSLMLYRGVSSTRYSSAVRVGNGWGSPLLDYATVDFTGNGLGDILTRHRDGRMLLYPNIGSNRFGSPVTIGQGWGDVRSWTAVRNGPTGRPTIYGIHTDGSLYRYDSNAAGEVVDSMRVGGGWSAIASIHNGGDPDRNGVSDLVALTNDGVLRIYLGTRGSSSMGGYKIGHGFSGYRGIGVVTEPNGTTHLRVISPSGGLINWVLSYSGSNDASAWGTAYQMQARSVAARYGCGNAVVVESETAYGGSGAAAPWYWTIYLRPGLGSQLTYVVAHECAHLMQYRAYGLSYSGWYELEDDANAVYGGSGYSGLEQNADCVTRYWGLTGYAHYTSSCSGERGSAAADIAAGRPF